MGSLVPRFATVALVGLLVAACSFTASPAPTATAAPSELTVPLASASTRPPTPVATPAPTTAPTASSSLPPLTPSASLPIRGSAREFSTYVVLAAPGPDGGLYVLIPTRKAPAILALLDSAGRPRAGWPVGLAGATSCEQLLPVEDGSVRVLCGLENPDSTQPSPIGAFAFDSDGRALTQWPVGLEGSFVTGRVIGRKLTLLASEEWGQHPGEQLTTVTADGLSRSGVWVPRCCATGSWAVGPDGAAYGIRVKDWSFSGDPEVSRITVLDFAGVRTGWPVRFDGIGSRPAFGPGGRPVVAAGSAARRTTRVLVFAPDGTVGSKSANLPISTVEYPDTGGCSAGSPQPPLVARDGTIFVYSEIDPEIYALAPSLEVMRAWPYRPAAPLARARPGLESEHEAGYCPAPVVPAVGPDSTLYLALEARNDAVGGRLVAVGPNGKARPGWPVELKRAGSEFWSVVVGSDGTVYALAIEPKSGKRSSATILAIAPDSTVLWTTTIIEP